MKYILRVFLFNVFALWFTSQIFPPLHISGSWQVIMIAGLILSILMLIVKPLLKILFIPINIITFGLLSWLINVIVIYLLTVLVPEVEINTWNFPGISYQGFSVPGFFISYYPALIGASLIITVFSNILHDISER